MKKITMLTVLALVLVAALFVTGCAKPEPEVVEKIVEKIVEVPVEAPAPVSDGSEDLKISFRKNLVTDDVENYFTFSGNIRYIAVDKDHADEVSGASALGSTHVFQPYIYDVNGQRTFSGGLRGVFLFAVTPYTQVEGDNFNASKAADGTITIQYAHRGTAYRIITDANGSLAFPNGTFEKRAIGYIASGAPQVISMDFSTDGTAATVDWAKVWDSSVADGKLVDDKSTKTTGPIARDADAATSMYYYDGALTVAIEGDILTIDGFLTAVGR